MYIPCLPHKKPQTFSHHGQEEILIVGRRLHRKKSLSIAWGFVINTYTFVYVYMYTYLHIQMVEIVFLS